MYPRSQRVKEKERTKERAGARAGEVAVAEVDRVADRKVIVQLKRYSRQMPKLTMPVVHRKKRKIGEMSQDIGMKASGIRMKNGRKMVTRAKLKAEGRLQSPLLRRAPNRRPQLNLAGELVKTTVVCAHTCIAFAMRTTIVMTSTRIRSSLLVCRVSPCGC